MSNVNPLVGRTIQEIHLSDDQIAIKFVLEDGTEVVADCDADCCSHTWIEDLINPESAIGSPVLSVTNVDLPEHLRGPSKWPEREEEMEYYGCEITTAKGKFLLAYRNASNGYYGGELVWPEQMDGFYGGVFAQNNSTHKWERVV